MKKPGRSRSMMPSKKPRTSRVVRYPHADGTLGPCGVAGTIQFVKTGLSESDQREVEHARVIAVEIEKRLKSQLFKIKKLTEQSASSVKIEGVIWPVLEAYKFEKQLVLDDDMIFVKPVPDFLLCDPGIIVEVEGGGTITNNHDLKDLWKCHLTDKAKHLILVVPRCNYTKNNKEREKPFERCEKRIKVFFDRTEKYIDVLSVHLVPYAVR